MPPARTDWQPRFWAKVVKGEGCWPWLGGVSTNGYARFRKHRGMSSEAVHRIAYELLRSPVPAGLDLDHLCRNRGCVNPDHLEPVTRGENLRRGDRSQWGSFQRAKDRCPAGHPYDEANTYVRKDRPNHRECRRCRNVASLAWQRRQRAKASGLAPSSS